MAYPQVSSITETLFTTNPTDHVIDMPASVSSGDLLIIILALESGTLSSSTPSGWTGLWERTVGACDFGGYAKVSDGTEGGTTVTVTSSSGSNGAAQVYRITSWYENILGVENYATPPTDATTTPNPPSVTASWGADDNLWIACGAAADDDESWSAAPTNYTNLTSTVSGGGVNDGASVGSARREYNSTDTQDPDTFTLSDTERWMAETIVIRPGTAGTAGSLVGGPRLKSLVNGGLVC